MPARPRAHDPERTRAALREQARYVGQAARALTADQYALPTRLGTWTVRELVTHLVRQVDSLPRLLREDPPATAAELPLVRWPWATEPLAGRMDEHTRATAEEFPDPAARLGAAVAELEAVLADPLPDRTVAPWPGVMTAKDFAITRLVELVVHADDLTAATGLDVPLDRHALAAVARLLADSLAAKAPGRSVELRVPPFAVVQCVEGPRHTRGTPPNVVETDPLTWVRLATGRLSWAEAADDGRLTASGERSDLSALLPVLA